MKKYLIVLFVLVGLTACSQSLRISWHQNPTVENVEYYKLYVFEGDSAEWLSFSVADMDSIGITAHLSGMPENYVRQYDYNFNEQSIIRAGVIAVDSLTRQSDIGLSDFYFHPTENITVEIIK